MFHCHFVVFLLTMVRSTHLKETSITCEREKAWCLASITKRIFKSNVLFKLKVASLQICCGHVIYPLFSFTLLKTFQYIIPRLFPVIEPGMSDSGCVDNAVEFLVMAGKRSLPEVSPAKLSSYKSDTAKNSEKLVVSTVEGVWTVFSVFWIGELLSNENW